MTNICNLLLSETLSQIHNNRVKSTTIAKFDENLEEKLNKIYINTYELQKEIEPEVTFENITILQDEIDPNGIKEIEKKY